MLPGACRVYAHDAAAAISYKIPPSYTPANWHLNRYSQEAWLAKALERHPWRVHNLADADVIVLTANFSQICTARKTYAARFLWHVHLNDTMLCDGTATGRGLVASKGDAQCQAKTPPKVMLLTNTECNNPWQGWGGPYMPPSHLPNDYLMAVDRRPRGLEQRGTRFVVPAVVAGPSWLVGSSDSEMPDATRALARRTWHERAEKLLFFPGHVPKLYVARRRFDVWDQMRRHPGVTSTSHTLNCTVGSYSVCASPRRIQTEARTFCLSACERLARSGPQKARAGTFAKQGGIICAARDASHLRRHCQAYRGVNFGDARFRADLERDSRYLTLDQYLREAFAHRFCLAVPGDFMSASPKITEFIAVGAAGGCIPVLVVPRDATIILPYADRLDYCSFAYLVRTPGNMRAALRSLENVTAEEAAAKHEGLRRVRDAFVWRAPERARPSAADYILQGVCELVRHRSNATAVLATLEASQRSQEAATVEAGAAGQLAVGDRCLLA